MKSKIIMFAAIALLTISILGCASTEEQAKRSAASKQAENKVSQDKEKILAVLKRYKIGETQFWTFISDAGITGSIGSAPQRTLNGWTVAFLSAHHFRGEQGFAHIRVSVGYSGGQLAILEFNDKILAAMQFDESRWYVPP